MLKITKEFIEQMQIKGIETIKDCNNRKEHQCMTLVKNIENIGSLEIRIYSDTTNVKAAADDIENGKEMYGDLYHEHTFSNKPYEIGFCRFYQLSDDAIEKIDNLCNEFKEYVRNSTLRYLEQLVQIEIEKSELRKAFISDIRSTLNLN